MLYKFDDLTFNKLDVISQETDEQLMSRIAVKEQASLACLYLRHRLFLRTIISRVLDNDGDVDDMLQEVFIEIWNQAGNYDAAKGKALGWIVTLARRRSIDRLRRKQAYYRAEKRLRMETESTSKLHNHHRADEVFVDADRRKIIQEILQTLPLAQRNVLHLTYFKGLSQREIAARTGIPLGTIKTRIELALRKVRTGVMSLGGTEEWSLNHA